jgi:3-isopropylmalate/(R)-2-methylmalate dehydratase small subunit
MEPFTTLKAIAAPIDQPDVDSDMLIPQRFLRKPLTVGYRNFFFFNDRFDAQGKPRPDFILNRAPFDKAKILVTAANFGCGSTREGAVYAAVDFGIRAIVAPSFGPFYASNCYQNGILTIVLPDADVKEMRAQLHAAPGGEISIDLPAQSVTDLKGKRYSFQIEPSRKERLLQGLDEIGITERYADALRSYEARVAAETPWLANSRLETLVQKR